jgi:hypothetical protein
LLQEQHAWIDRLRPESELKPVEELRHKRPEPESEPDLELRQKYERNVGLDSLPHDHPTASPILVLALEDRGAMVPPWY